MHSTFVVSKIWLLVKAPSIRRFEIWLRGAFGTPNLVSRVPSVPPNLALRCLRHHKFGSESAFGTLKFGSEIFFKILTLGQNGPWPLSLAPLGRVLHVQVFSCSYVPRQCGHRMFFYLKMLKKSNHFHVLGVTMFRCHLQPWPENGKEIAMFKRSLM